MLLMPLTTFAAALYRECSPCGSCAPCDPVCSKKESKLKIRGWVQASYYRNAWGCENEYVYNPVYKRNLVSETSGNSTILGTSNNADFQMNQAWLVFEREKDTKNGFDWGFRVDLAYGTDLWAAQTLNDESFDFNWGEGDYYGSIPNLYADFGYKNLGVKIGRFPTLIGYESFEAPSKFFLSSCNMFWLEPLATTGFLADYTIGKLTLYAGWTMGNDTWSNDFGDSAITGGLSFQMTEDMLLYAVFTTGYEYDKYDSIKTVWKRGFPSDRNEFLKYTIAADWKFGKKKKWNYILQYDYNQDEWEDGFQPDFADTGVSKGYGINNTLIYRFNDRWAIGGRFEWWRIEGNETGALGRTDNGNDLYQYTLGLNWTPLKNLILTAEIRYDQAFDDKDARHGYQPFANGTKNDQFSGGISGTVHF